MIKYSILFVLFYSSAFTVNPNANHNPYRSNVVRHTTIFNIEERALNYKKTEENEVIPYYYRGGRIEKNP